MKTIRVLLVLVAAMALSGCATCPSPSLAVSSNPSPEDKPLHPFWEWFGELAGQNLFDWAVHR